MKKRQAAAAGFLGVAAVILAGAAVKGGLSGHGTASADEKQQVTIRLFTNLPDRKNGQGLVEQLLVEEYMQENPDVTIQVEALDEEAYKIKFRAYVLDGLPDVVSVWGQPAFLDDVLEAGVLAELDEAEYDGYEFIEGSLEGFKKDGKLYGLPRNTDVASFYYNRKIFEEHGWNVPSTYGELLELGQEIRQAGIVPVAMDGMDGWPLALFLSDVLYQLEGDYQELVREAVSTGDFSAPAFAEAVALLRDADEAGLFQDGYDQQDYGAAMNLFATGQAAMYYMGSWEASMAVNESIPAEVRENIRVFSMPSVEGGKAAAEDLAAWNGGGYAVSAESEVKEEAVRFLNFVYQPDKLSKYGWENGIGLSAQDQSGIMTGAETDVQLQYVELVRDATGMSGTPINDCGPSAYKSCIEKEIQRVANGSMDIEEFLTDIGNACR